MSDSAFQKKFRQEFIAGFEKSQSLVRHTVTTETEINGNEATFLVADSGGAAAVTRGNNGDIPTRPDNLNQYTATLTEWHDVPERTNFNIYASQGNGRAIMQQTSMAVINRKIDKDIHAALATSTLTWGVPSVATLALILKTKTKLANNFADEGQVYALITPAFYAYLLSSATIQAAFASSDYVSDKKFEGISKDKAFAWLGINWVVDGGLDGVGTGAAKCYMYNQKAVGHACDMTSLSTHVGYDEKNDKSWARCSTYMGSKLLQNSGVVQMLHDDSAYS